MAAAVESPARRAGGWRESFLSRHRRDRGDDGSEFDEADREREPRTPRVRSTSRSRPAEATEAFDQKAVLDQDRALIEQLTQRQPRRERSVVRKPPPPPKVSPYRGHAGASPSGSSASGGAGAGAPTLLERLPVADDATAGASPVSPEKGLSISEANTGVATVTPAATPVPDPSALSETPSPASPPSARAEAVVPTAQPVAVPTAPVAPPAAPAERLPAVVPRAGPLFTASDIDSLMDRLGGSPGQSAKDMAAGDAAAGRGGTVATAPVPVDPGECQQNFGDISKEFYRDHRMEVPEPVALAEENEKKAPDDKQKKPFVVPDRRALKEQINAIDSWLEDDFGSKEKLSGQRQAPTAGLLGAPAFAPAANLQEVAAGTADPAGTPAEAEVLRKLEEAKRKKAAGQRVTPVFLKDIATQAKPLFPTLGLESLVKMLRLFTSARYEDHDLYLRILGEIPVQVRGITPELLTTCVRVLRRLRLPEETYLELFSMEAMNMIRAKRRPQARAPRRPPAPTTRTVVQPAPGSAVPTPSGGGPALTPVPPPAPPPEVPAPFSPAELVHIGNSLTQLGAKHPTRFLEVFQEQLALAIPRMTQEECEMVEPTLAFSQLMHDPLRRAFLERCAKVDAGEALPTSGGCAAPDIAQFQREAEQRRRRQKRHRNIYAIEASVRKETFSFFSSLSPEVRTYLDRLHAAAEHLPHEGSSKLAAQVADVLDQLGVECQMSKTSGPLSLHVVAKATNPRAEVAEVVYECSDAQAFYAQRPEDKGATPQPTSQTKFRHKLLSRLGVQLTHINGYEWLHMSEAQRVNYMVRLQSLQ